ncbi:alpha/beta hydrolase [Planococcus beigongshangi]|uniref:alpha/beta hydrolase n=1 Tax=Planococcus beigongshangi TaxID=2782536 RepID=UPI001EEDC869|nr:alpha/beta hydrolase [Planococcus beigongshangi]
MNKSNRFLRNKIWIYPILIGLLVMAVISTIELLTSADAEASREPGSSAVFAPPPHIDEIRAEVVVIADIVYEESSGALLDIYMPAELDDSVPVILWIHGGGFVGGSKDSRRDYAMTLAHDGYVVANMDYGLAPEQLYPGPVVQANAALNYLTEHASEFGGDMDRVFIGGDSAGAHIASQLSAVLSNGGLAEDMGIQPAIESDKLRGALLFCGLYNMETVAATGFPNIEYFLNTYTGTVDFEKFARIQELSIVQQVMPDFPDSFIAVGDGDPLASQSVELAGAIRAQGAAVETMFFEGTGKNLQHEFQYALDTLDAQETLRRTLNFLSIKSR